MYHTTMYKLSLLSHLNILDDGLYFFVGRKGFYFYYIKEKRSIIEQVLEVSNKRFILSVLSYVKKPFINVCQPLRLNIDKKRLE